MRIFWRCSVRNWCCCLALFCLVLFYFALLFCFLVFWFFFLNMISPAVLDILQQNNCIRVTAWEKKNTASEFDFILLLARFKKKRDCCKKTIKIVGFQSPFWRERLFGKCFALRSNHVAKFFIAWLITCRTYQLNLDPEKLDLHFHLVFLNIAVSKPAP